MTECYFCVLWGNVIIRREVIEVPKETFLKLSNEKQQKVLDAAKKEFARVPIENVSIKNIVEDADIARGSFYQYFESKEDLLVYLLKEKAEQVSNKVKEKIQETDGDLFETYIFLYDMAIENFMKKEDEDLYKQIFINIKSSDESIFDLMKNTKPKDVIKYCDLLNTKNLKIENQQDFMVICEMLNAITRKAIIKNFKRVSKEECRSTFLKEIEYLKYGIIKKETNY